MRIGAARAFLGASVVALAGCASILGLDEPGDDDAAHEDASVGASSSGGRSDAEAATSSSSGHSDPPRDSGNDADAAAASCPSAADECLAQTVLTQLRSPGELVAFGGKLAFREHAKNDGGAYSTVRVYDGSGTCSDGTCLPTLTTGENMGQLLAANAKHLCYAVPDSTIHCVNATTLAGERTLVGGHWWYQAGFVADHELLYATYSGGGTTEIRSLDVAGTGDPVRLVGPVGPTIQHLVASNAGDAWFGWYERDGRLAARRADNATIVEFSVANPVHSLAAVGDSFVWATSVGIYYSRYSTGGAGVGLAGPQFGSCGSGLAQTYRSITPAGDSVIAIEGCSIPGSLGSVLVRYPLDQSEPVLLATVPLSLSSAVVLGDYVYYALARIPAFWDDQPIDEIRRIRYR